jgi:photosystem II stability/assembly factor-like uncharacterized protein
MSRLDNPGGLHLYAARRRGDRIVIAGEQGLILSSQDGGASFKRLATPYNGSFFTLELPSDADIVVGGLRGNVWRSADAGGDWAQVATPMRASITASDVRKDGSSVLVDQAGEILSLRKGAISPVNAPGLPPLNGVLVLGDGSLLVLSNQGPLLLPVSVSDGRPQGVTSEAAR